MFQSQEKSSTSETEVLQHPPKCLEFFSEFRRCISSYHQFHMFYIYGKYDSCEKERQDLTNCFLWRARSKEAKEALQKSMAEKERRKKFVDKPSSSVWTFRENPAEDWNKT